jgi:large subunit ribosomal protein L5|tara:strand:- start:17 stop:604 length:588 start_codon:yes stop_codon:yes gene_type:complete
MAEYTPRLQKHYKEVVVKDLSAKLGTKNVMQVPCVVKVVLNMGIGSAKEHANWITQAVAEFTAITGQKPIINKAKKAISNFKLRENDPVGISVTLRRERMYEFLDRFISIAAPRIRDFRGLPNRGFDGRGNYNFGVTEQIIFPEIDYDKVNQIRGLNITIVTTAKTDEDAFELLLAMGMPIRQKVVQVEEEEVAA